MEKEIKLNRGWSLTKYANGSKYMLTGKGIFMHGDKIELATNNKDGTWVNFRYNDAYIGSIWVDSISIIKEIKKFIKEEK